LILRELGMLVAEYMHRMAFGMMDGRRN
jgi:hypothetical protein